MNTNLITVLFVDDEQENINSFKANFRKQYNLYFATSGNDALKLLVEQNVHVVITDYRMADMNGLNFLKKAKFSSPHTIRLMLSAYTDSSVLIDAINQVNIYKYLTKPLIKIEVEESIEEAFEIYTFRQQNFDVYQKLIQANEKLAKYEFGNYLKPDSILGDDHRMN